MGRILTQLAGLFLGSFVFLTKMPAQSGLVFGTGLDTAAYDALPVFTQYSGRKGEGNIKKTDLRPFCPTPGQQASTGACAGFALGYGAMTLSYALEKKLTDRSEIDKHRFSATFIYNQIKKKPNDCTEYSEMCEAINLAKSIGNCPAEVFERLDNCQVKPTPEQIAIASRFKIQEAGAIFERSAPERDKIEVIRHHLMDSIPIIVNFEVRKSFVEMPHGQGFWRHPQTPSEDPYVGSHFLLIVGFDDESQVFEVMNSCGENWADYGFAKIAYEDMGHFCKGAYRVIFAENLSQEKSAKLARQKVLGPDAAQQPENWLSGSFGFNRIAEDGTPVSEPVLFDEALEIYRPANGPLALGTQFQLTTTNMPPGVIAYVVSCDSEGNVKQHFPKNEKARLSPSKNAVVTIPSESTVLALRKRGVDYLCILYSNGPIKGINWRMQQLKAGNNQVFLNSFERAFGEFTNSDFQGRRYEPTKMAGKVKYSGKSTVVLPIILAVKTAD